MPRGQRNKEIAAPYLRTLTGKPLLVCEGDIPDIVAEEVPQEGVQGHKCDSSGGKTIWRVGIIEAPGIVQCMTMKLRGREIGFVPLGKYCTVLGLEEFE